jgi:mono/diheme cytochrome c family protein
MRTDILRSAAALLTLAVAVTGQAWGQGSSAASVLERGKLLMEGIVACGNCHQARDDRGRMVRDKGLSGGMVFDEPPFRAVAANITPDAATGIGKWSDAQLAKAIREGIRPDGSLIGPPMPMEFYRHLSDADLAAIVAYLRAQPAVVQAQPKSVYRITLPPAYGPPVQSVAAPAAGDAVAAGEYLARIGHCMDCHTPRTAEGELVMEQLGAGGMQFPGPWGLSVSRNLTPHDSGLKGWSDDEIARAIRTGVSRDGSKLRPPMGYAYYRNIGDADMAALIAYLRSLKPLAFAGKN